MPFKYNLAFGSQAGVLCGYCHGRNIGKSNRLKIALVIALYPKLLSLYILILFGIANNVKSCKVFLERVAYLSFVSVNWSVSVVFHLAE